MSSLQTATSKKPRLNSAFQRLMSIHWWMAGCYLILFVVGTVMAQLPKNNVRNTLYDFHKSIGVLELLGNKLENPRNPFLVSLLAIFAQNP